jgi:hypothetical protein
VPPPALDEQLRGEVSVEALRPKQFVTLIAVEALDLAVLPRQPGHYAQCLHADAYEVLSDRLRSELTPSFASHIPLYSSTPEEVAELVEHVLAGELPSDIVGGALPRVIAHGGPHPNGTAYQRAVHPRAAVLRPAGVGMRWGIDLLGFLKHGPAP